MRPRTPSWNLLLAGILFISRGHRKARVVDPVWRFCLQRVFSETSRGVWSPAVLVLAVCSLSLHPAAPGEPQAARAVARTLLGGPREEDSEDTK